MIVVGIEAEEIYFKVADRGARTYLFWKHQNSPKNLLVRYG